MQGEIVRRIEGKVRQALDRNPIVYLSGPRRVGKTLLARAIVEKSNGIRYDVAASDDRALLSDPVNTPLNHNDNICMVDNVNYMPTLLYPVLPVPNENNAIWVQPGILLLAGDPVSNAIDVISKSTSIPPVVIPVHGIDCLEIDGDQVPLLWDRGCLPNSFFSDNARTSLALRDSYIGSQFLRDSSGYPPPSYDLFLQISDPETGPATVRNLERFTNVKKRDVQPYLDQFEKGQLVRKVLPYNGKQIRRPVRHPRYYIRDSGIVHAMWSCSIFQLRAKLTASSDAADSGFKNFAERSWEGFVIENLFGMLEPGWHVSFYQSHLGDALDIVLEFPDNETWAIIARRSPDGRLTKNNRKALEVLQPDRVYIVHCENIESSLSDGAEALPLRSLMQKLQEKATIQQSALI